MNAERVAAHVVEIGADRKVPFDPLSILLINDAYKCLTPESILEYLRSKYTNLSSLSSTVSRLRNRFRKIGIPENITSRLHLPSEAYKALRKRSRDTMLQALRPPSSKFNVLDEAKSKQEDQSTGMRIPIGMVIDHEIKDSDRGTAVLCDDAGSSTHRLSVDWANTTYGIPRIFRRAYHVLAWRRFPLEEGGQVAEPAHVYAALNLLTGLGPHKLLNPDVTIRSGKGSTVSPHTGNFEAYWICVSPNASSKHSTREQWRRFDRPCLFVASRVVRAIQWMRRALNLTPTTASVGEVSRNADKTERILISRRFAWARRSILKTFGPAVASDAHIDTGGERSNGRNCNPDHRFTLALYVAATAANYFEGFSVNDTAGYLNINGDFYGLKTPFTPLVSMLQRSTALSFASGK